VDMPGVDPDDRKSTSRFWKVLEALMPWYML